MDGCGNDLCTRNKRRRPPYERYYYDYTISITPNFSEPNKQALPVPPQNWSTYNTPGSEDLPLTTKFPNATFLFFGQVLSSSTLTMSTSARRRLLRDFKRYVATILVGQRDEEKIILLLPPWWAVASLLASSPA
jgi:hypothetical protein